MLSRRADLKIPYGIADFKRIRNEGWYYVDKTENLAKLEERDSFVFFVRPRRFGKSLFVDMLRLYYDRNEKANFELAAKAEEGIAQLRRYAADPTVPALSAGTRLHLILYQFKGTELVRCEEISSGCAEERRVSCPVT